MKDIKEQISELNAIESDFLKTLALINPETKSGINICAAELAGKVQRFTKWSLIYAYYANDSGYFGLWSDSDIRFKTESDLWKFWLKEIDTKK